MSLDAWYSELNFVSGILPQSTGDDFLVFSKELSARLSLHFLHGSRTSKTLKSFKRCDRPSSSSCLFGTKSTEGIGAGWRREPSFPVKRHRMKAPDKRHQKQHFVQVAGAGRFSAEGLVGALKSCPCPR